MQASCCNVFRPPSTSLWQQRRASTRRAGGVTLIELMVSLAILAVLASIAVPSFQRQLGQARTERAAQTIAAALTLARTEAIKRNTTVAAIIRHDAANRSVTVCLPTSATAATCGPTVLRNDTWNPSVQVQPFNVSLVSGIPVVHFHSPGVLAMAAPPRWQVSLASDASLGYCVRLRPGGTVSVKNLDQDNCTT